jgi:hypothetical protein
MSWLCCRELWTWRKVLWATEMPERCLRYVGEVSETSMDLVNLEWYGMALSFLSVPLPSRLRLLVMVELSENEGR